MSDKILMYAALGVGAYLVLPQLMGSGGATSLIPGAPASSLVTQTNIPGVVQAYGTYLLTGFTAPVPFSSAGNWNTIDKTWYLTWEYPAHQKVNSNIGNASYTLAPGEAQQYLQNYLDVNQWSTSAAVLKQFGNQQAAAQYHWKTFGAIERRTFLPLYPPFNTNWVPPVTPAQPAKSSSGSWVTSALSIAGSVVALLGPNDPPLSAMDQQILFTGSAVLKQVLPYYYKSSPKLSGAIESRMDALLNQYS